jgi:uncharacterized protein
VVEGRAWKSDAELEAEMSSQRYGSVQQAVRPPPPRATYFLLGAIGVTFLLEWLTLVVADIPEFYTVWTIFTDTVWYDWIYRPWSPITATFAHHPYGVTHILFNSIGLFFFGPMLEQIVGRLRFVSLFVLTGALSSAAQASIDHLFDPPGGPALGASGAIMALIGVAIMINPKAKIFMLFFPVPIPLWAAGIIFAVIDILGALGGASGVGNFAHLSGMAIGLLYGISVKREMEAKGMHFVTR